MMLSKRFHGLFDKLVGSFTKYQAAPRDPDRVVELASARAELDDVRGEVFEEGKDAIRDLRQLRITDPQAYARAMRDRR